MFHHAPNKPPTDDLGDLDHLFTQAGQYRSTEKFAELLEFLGRFPHYAPYNAMLLHIQKPGSQYVADIQEWRKLGRTIKPNARPLIILWAFAPVHLVYELEDTEGLEFSSDMMQAFQTRGHSPKNLSELYDNLIYNLPMKGIRLAEGDFAQNYAGHIEVNEYRKANMIIHRKNILVLYNLVINANQDIKTKISTIAHELGHMLCKHLPQHKIKTDEETGQKSVRWSEPNQNWNESVQEFEAESVAYLVCKRLGLKLNSERYLSGYLEHENLIPPISMDKVLKATGSVENMLHKRLSIPKELLLPNPPTPELF